MPIAFKVSRPQSNENITQDLWDGKNWKNNKAGKSDGECCYSRAKPFYSKPCITQAKLWIPYSGLINNSFLEQFFDEVRNLLINSDQKKPNCATMDTIPNRLKGYKLTEESNIMEIARYINMIEI